LLVWNIPGPGARALRLISPFRNAAGFWLRCWLVFGWPNGSPNRLAFCQARLVNHLIYQFTTYRSPIEILPQSHFGSKQKHSLRMTAKGLLRIGHHG